MTLERELTHRLSLMSVAHPHQPSLCDNASGGIDRLKSIEKDAPWLRANIQLSGDFLCRPDAGLVRPVAGALPTIDGDLTGKEQAFIDRAFQIGALVCLSG